MLEVHAPHQASRSWTDFLVHIATIVIGLLIAIGLEQTVEYFHHRNRLRDARQELAAEVHENLRRTAWNQDATRRFTAELANDMVILRVGQSADTSQGAQLSYSMMGFIAPADGAWQAARQDGSLSLMPRRELQEYAAVYSLTAHTLDAIVAFSTQAETAGAISRRSPDGNLSPHDIEELITATSASQGKLSFLQKLLEFEEQGLMRREASVQ